MLPDIELGNPKINNYADTNAYDNDIKDAFNYVEDLYNSRRAKRRINIANRYASKHGADESFLGFTPTKDIDIYNGEGSGFVFKGKKHFHRS